MQSLGEHVMGPPPLPPAPPSVRPSKETTSEQPDPHATAAKSAEASAPEAARGTCRGFMGGTSVSNSGLRKEPRQPAIDVTDQRIERASVTAHRRLQAAADGDHQVPERARVDHGRLVADEPLLIAE